MLTPSTVWTLFEFTAEQVFGQTTFCGVDYTRMGLDVHAIYLQFFIGACGSITHAVFVIRKSTALGAGPLVITGLANAAGYPVDNMDPNPTFGYLVSTAGINRISDPGGTPTLSATQFYSPFGPFNQPGIAPVRHQGNAQESGVPDDTTGRMFLANFDSHAIPIRNGRLWYAVLQGVDNLGNPSAGVRTRNGIQWIEAGNLGAGAPTVLQKGLLYTASPDNDYNQRNFFIPALGLSGQGHMVLASSAAGTFEYINAAVAGRLATDPPGTIRDAVLYTNSQAAYNPTIDRPPLRRWGDYSHVSPDPCDDMTMWAFQQYTSSADNWSVAVAQIKAPPPPAVTTLSQTVLPYGSPSINLTITGTPADGEGFYDPGTGFGCRLAAGIDGGVVVNSVTYTSPTSITLNVSTLAASGGSRRVTISNPDGQTVTDVGHLSVSAPPVGVPVLTAPQNQQTIAGQLATFSIKAAGAGPLTYRWQASANGISWQNVSDGATYGGTATPTLVVGASTGLHGSQYRCVVTNAVGGSTSAAATLTVTIVATMSLDRSTLRFGAVKTNSTINAVFLSQTAAQIVRLTQTGAGTVTWTARTNQPWLRVSPSLGTGSTNLSVSVVPADGLPSGSTVTGAITLTVAGALNTPAPVTVSLNIFYDNGSSAPPIGVVDTPLNNTTGVTGAIPFTGWALDDVEVQRLSVCRSAVGGEVAPVDPNCGGTAQIFVGFAVFIDGARPDVAATYPTFPVNTKGGWGFMVLTNTLPSQGNGTFVFHMWAKDRDGHSVAIGSRTMTCANGTSILPFGAIDTPTQGGVASGAAYNVFGWVLSRTNRADPPGGGTVVVQVDGVTVGNPGGWTARPDLTATFPGFPGITTALAVFGLDTTSLANGLHTIQWVATDNMSRTEGIGSRFFTVSNGTGAVTAAGAMIAAGEAQAHAAFRAGELEGIADAPLDSGAIVGRRGWDLTAPYLAFAAGGSGRVLVRSEEVNRVELRLGPAEHYSGRLRTSAGLSPLPIGSHLDGRTGVFTWAPGVGFVGAYDLVFVRWDGTAAVARHEVRIILAPKGSHLVGPQVVIDAPRSQQDVGQPFHLGGWAVDLNAAHGTGIATLHAWAYPLTGGPPVFLGATSYGGARPDVAATHGDQFAESSFGLTVQGLTPGNYDLAVFAWSTELANFVPARTVRVTVRP